MFERGERLWPDESEQPSLELFFHEESYLLTWDNTSVIVHRVNDDEYDEKLTKYDHILHQYGHDEEGKTLNAVWFFDQLDPGCVDYLMTNNYTRQLTPIPRDYVRQAFAAREASKMPGLIGPDFGTSDEPWV